jgi:hypothetical protein
MRSMKARTRAGCSSHRRSVYHAKVASFLLKTVSEPTLFPNFKTDDIADAISLAFARLHRQPPERSYAFVNTDPFALRGGQLDAREKRGVQQGEMEMTAAAEREYAELLRERRPHAISSRRAYDVAMREIEELTIRGKSRS